MKGVAVLSSIIFLWEKQYFYFGLLFNLDNHLNCYDLYNMVLIPKGGRFIDLPEPSMLIV